MELGEDRSPERWLEIATVLSKNLDASLPQAFAGNPRQREAVYRFFQNEAIDPEELHEAHHAQTLRRSQTFPLVLAVQDTAQLDFSHPPATTPNLPHLANRLRSEGKIRKAAPSLRFAPFLLGYASASF